MSAEASKAVIRRIVEEVLNGGNEAVIDQLVSPSFMSHEEGMGGAGAEGFKQAVKMYRTAFPDVHLEVEFYVAEGDLVVTWGTFGGTHNGPLEGIPATGKPVNVKDVDLWRVENGKLVESWSHLDQASLMMQLGVGMMEEGEH
jgi:steroid delta-isomerase-like uncharacterized protein